MVLQAAGIREGMTRDEVEAELGRPTAVLKKGDRLVLTYPKQGRVELMDGRVVEMAFVPVAEGGAVPEPEPKQLPKTKAVEETKPASGAAAKPSSSSAKPASKPSAVQPAFQSEPEEHGSSHGSHHTMLVLLVGGVIRILITMVVLKLSFKWADVHADWSQMIAPAVIDALVRAGISIVAMIAFKTDSLFYVDEAIAYFALLVALMKTTHACTLPRAIAVAAGAKLMSVVVGSAVTLMVLKILS